MRSTTSRKKDERVQNGRRDFVIRHARARFDDRRALRELHRGYPEGWKLNAPIDVGNVFVTILQLSNIAWEVNRELDLDTKDGRIQNDAEAVKMWARE